MKNKILPLGIDSFKKIRTEDYYYIDKTVLITELLTRDRSEVNLITRPRRFGKTLAMNMLAQFFDIREDSSEIFNGLIVFQNKELCGKWMNQWPVLFITFKNIDNLIYEQACEQIAIMMSDLCMEHSYLMTSDKVDVDDKAEFAALKSKNATNGAVCNGLFLLTRMMKAYYGKQVILLIDEYDVPLAKAYEYGYYNQMLNQIRTILNKALESNPYLKFSVVTGCLRIAKESIFTGTNYFVYNTISSDAYTDAFGFTKSDVGRLLADMGLESHADDMKRWYDGYQICSSEIYCPWDVLNYVRDLKNNPNSRPKSYWKNTSHNDIIRSFIAQEGFDVTKQLENLLAGGWVKVHLCDDLTYDLVHSSEENFWNILYMTGYLTGVKPEEISDEEELGLDEVFLRIPNEEIKMIFTETIVVWFKDRMKLSDRGPLLDALWSVKEELASSMLSDLLFQTISYHNYREDYYHAFLAGIFVGLGYAVESDKEHGEGRPDMVIIDRRNRRAMIIEVKRSKYIKNLEQDCDLAVSQLIGQKYAEDFLEGFKKTIGYGIAFYKKQCRLKGQELRMEELTV